jgi:hypothetical protein
MAQPESFAIEDKEHMRRRLKKFIYGLKQASSLWYLKFDKVIKKFGFVKNQVDNCIYFNIKGSMFIILILYVDDIILASSDKNLLYETKRFLSPNFDTKDLGDASYILGIEIHRERTKRCAQPISKCRYRESAKKYNMHDCSGMPVLFLKGDKLRTFQNLRNQLVIDQMKLIPYASVIMSIMYAQVCTHPNLAFVTEFLDRFQSNPEIKHWKATKKVLRYLQGTKHYMLTYKKPITLK